MKRISFTLSMPNNNSWNGKWSGRDNLYVIVKSLKDDTAEKILQKSSYYYHWPDGWSACVATKEIDTKEARRLKRKSDGFCGYSWMVDSIIERQEIVTKA